MISNEQLLAFVRKNPIALSCGVLAIALGAAIYFRGEGVPIAEADLEQKSAEGRRLALNLKQSAQLPEQSAAMTAALAEIEPRIVHADELANNLQYFYKLESETGTKLGELRQGGPAKTGAKAAKAPQGPGSFVPVPFSTTVQGEYGAVLDFLRRLETGTHFPRVVGAGITLTTPDRTGPLLLQLEVELLGQP
jgi:hypothetical protein